MYPQPPQDESRAEKPRTGALGSHAYLTSAYLLSLPERILRAAFAGLGGLLYELTQLLLPRWLRGTRLYQAIVYRLLRISVELIGGVENVFPQEDIGVGELALRKTFGNVIELMGFVTLGWSPLWILAAASDLTGGTRAYLNAFVAELKAEDLLAEEVDVTSVEDLLLKLESSSATMADLVDVPPLKARELRESWQILKTNANFLPDASRLTGLYQDMQRVAHKQGRSLGAVSALVAAGALRAGVRLGSVHVFDYYTQALKDIHNEGWGKYALRIARPYFSTVRGHFDSRRVTHTQRLFRSKK
jgi:hypothetical protein